MAAPCRRDVLKQMTGATLGGLTAGSMLNGCGNKPMPEGPWNFVFFLVDDMGWPDTGCYGNTFNESPNVDRLASQGMRFTDAYAACPVCSPTRASIMTGKYPAHLGITDFITGHWRPYEKLRVPINRTQYLPHEEVTFAEALQEAGYVSGAFGKWHLGNNTHFPASQGFADELVTGRHFGYTARKTDGPVEKADADAYVAERLTDEAVRFLTENKDNPFCLYLAHYAVHIPLEAREEKIRKYENKPKPNDQRVNNPVYAAMVEHVDDSIGQIMATLDELHLADNTVLVFFSDNGGLRMRFTGDQTIVSSNYPLRDEKGTVYEGGIREPLIIRWPGVVEPGSTCDTPVSSVDFLPTFTDIAGVTGGRPDGESIVPLLRQSGNLSRDAIYWHYPHYHHSVPAGAIRNGDYKLIEFYDDQHVELYNLREDIGESNNLVDAMPDKASELQQQLADWRKSVGAEMPVKNPDYDPARAHEWGTHPSRTQ
jgi:arylsulfatase A